MFSIKWMEIAPIFRRALKTALIVGPLLTVINQWEVISGASALQYGKVGLTFLVPFCVSFYTGIAMHREMRARQSAKSCSGS